MGIRHRLPDFEDEGNAKIRASRLPSYGPDGRDADRMRLDTR
ncbi:hypothetical protein NI35_0267 [Salmonella enterica subsp. enterica serovar Cerro]|uniref:Uncharacterized protein n=3 Tax=Salmonella enterica I TaxID=59201 RepID=A0A6C6Z369_SALPB|nr:hypothetical protein SPAB_02347 [Salmonella enterica subsp. enterica serovar Paratyphi B str. SPB7]APT77913.1 hypothetical protein GW13_PRO1037 [Salmonella enterica subsp. enterica serovar Cerro]EHC67026.1 hypothetical protein LTSEJOH_1575 [Salmonella enterica subsp. enterica serovar Johannesburg str. S5-703]EHC75966.1 hypothetical protein LTSEMON_3940 [Salmonella enterica subsp. enterica serovar Montevideo str. S5-403]EHC87412.1 hypothetical protein LTSERUB_3133 [Salmonella enterica subsp. 